MNNSTIIIKYTCKKNIHILTLKKIYEGSNLCYYIIELLKDKKRIYLAIRTNITDAKNKTSQVLFIKGLQGTIMLNSSNLKKRMK